MKVIPARFAFSCIASAILCLVIAFSGEETHSQPDLPLFMVTWFLLVFLMFALSFENEK